MTGIGVRGTTDPDEIAVVLAVLRRSTAAAPDGLAPDGLAAWRRRRRGALAVTAGRIVPESVRFAGPASAR